MSRPIRLAPTLLTTCVAGCAAALPPGVEVMDVRLSGAALLDRQLAVTLCVSNPNADELAFRRVTADLDLAGLPLVAGTSDQAVRLPPRASTVVPFTVVATARNLGQQLLAAVRTGQVEYRLHGTVTLGGAVPLRLPYARSGRVGLVAGGFALATAEAAPSRCSASTDR